jgi:hypothetical protein
MALETGLRTLLLAQPSIASLVPTQTVDGNTYQRIFNEHPARKIVPPYILIHLIDFDPYACLDGTSGLSSYEIDIDCYAVEYPDSVAIASAVHTFLKDYTGPAGALDSIKAVIWLNKRHDKVFEDQGRDVRHHIESMSFQIQAS